MKTKIITTVNGTDHDKEMFNLFKEKFKGNDRSMGQENNGRISRIDEEFVCKDFYETLLRHNYIPKKMLYCEIRPRMKDNTLCKTKLENYRPVIMSWNISHYFETKTKLYRFWEGGGGGKGVCISLIGPRPSNSF